MLNMRVTLELLQEILKEFYPKLMIESFREEPGSSQGDNYTAMLYRVHINAYRLSDNEKIFENFSIIYKCLPDNIIRRKAFKSETLFCNEVVFYTVIVPILYEFQNKKLDEIDKFKAIPNCFLAKNDIIVLQDLCFHGYQMNNRKLDLSYDTSLIIIKELAKFHAFSLGLKIQGPDRFFSVINNDNGIQETYFTSENEEWYRDYYEIASRNALDMVKQTLAEKVISNHYYDVFERFLNNNFFQTMISLVKPVEPLSVICHGDCWSNNIMYRVNNNQTEVCFIDFQICRYASPMLDLTYLLYLCTSKSLRDEKLNDLITYYNDVLYNQLSKLLQPEVEIDTIFMPKDRLEKSIFEEFKKCSLFALGLSLDMIPILTCDNHQAPNLYENSSKCDKNYPVVTTNSTCREKITDLVIELVDNGYLNCKYSIDFLKKFYR